jgi:hypothetical protein
MTQIRRGHWGRLIGATAVVIAGAFVLPQLMRAPDLEEHRTLADAPALPRRLGDLTAFRKATDAYVADRFPPRAQLIGAINFLRMKLGVSGSRRVIVGRDGWLFSDDGSHLGATRGDPPLSDADAAKWLGTLASRTESLRAEGRAYVVFTPPVKDAIHPDKAPRWFSLDLNRPAVTLSRLARASGAGEVIYPADALAQQARWGLHVYDRYESHWTGLGAYHGYVAFMNSLHRQGLAEAPRPVESFALMTDVEEAATPRDLALMLGVASFVDVDYPQIEDPTAAQTLRVTYLSAKRDWTGLHVIETGQAGKPVLLITVDSYSNALMPYLYGHFSRIIVAHNQDGAWRRDLIDRFQPDIVAIEILENGMRNIMADAAAPSAQAQARIRDVVAHRQRYAVLAQTPLYHGERKKIEGGPDNELLQGASQPDDMQGRPGDDTLNGLEGDDLMRGGRGRDSLSGGGGRDWISGGRDDDVLRGGRGGDIFNIFEGAGTDQVLDFSIAEGDSVEVGLGMPYTVRQAGPDTVIDLYGARLVLRGVAMADLPKGAIRSR